MAIIPPPSPLPPFFFMCVCCCLFCHSIISKSFGVTLLWSCLSLSQRLPQPTVSLTPSVRRAPDVGKSTKKKGYVSLVTTEGTLNFVIHSDIVWQHHVKLHVFVMSLFSSLIFIGLSILCL